LLLSACAGETFEPGSSLQRQTIQNGTAAQPGANQVVQILHVDSSTHDTNLCTGTLVANDWVLTAAHCVRMGDGHGAVISASSLAHGPNASVLSAAVQVYQFQVQGGPGSAVDRVVVHPSSQPDQAPYDIALLHLSTPFSVNNDSHGYTQPLSAIPAEWLEGTVLTCYGWGQTVANNINSSNFTTAQIAVAGVAGGVIFMNPNAAGQIQLEGDSGGPCFLDDGNGSTEQVSVLSMVQTSASGGGGNVQGEGSLSVEVAAVRGWLMDTLAGTQLDGDVAASSVTLAQGAPAVAVDPGNGQVDVFVRTLQNNLAHTHRDPVTGQWPTHTPYETVPFPAGVVASDPAAIYDSSGDLWAFFRTSASNVYAAHSVGGSWYLYNLLGSVSTAPTVVSTSPGSFDLFATASTGHLMHIAMKAGTWSAWSDMGGTLDPTSRPAAAVRSTGQIDLIAVAPNGQVQYLGYSSTNQYTCTGVIRGVRFGVPFSFPCDTSGWVNLGGHAFPDVSVVETQQTVYNSLDASTQHLAMVVARQIGDLSLWVMPLVVDVNTPVVANWVSLNEQGVGQAAAATQPVGLQAGTAVVYGERYGVVVRCTLNTNANAYGSCTQWGALPIDDDSEITVAPSPLGIEVFTERSTNSVWNMQD
jgi:hypothetical protein